MPNLNITVTNKIATGDSTKIVCGNSDYTAVFTFDSEWDAYASKTMRVEYGSSYTDVVFTGNSATLPVISNVLGVKIGVYAGSLHTTTPAFFDAVKSILCDSGTPVTPSTSVYEQIMTKLNGIEGDIGDLDDLETTAKDDLVSAINEAAQSGGSGGFNIHALTTEDDIADTDETPFYDLSATANRKTTWSNIKTKLKAYFDNIYQATISDLATIRSNASTGAGLATDVTANTNARHTHSNKALLDTYTQTEADLADAVSKKHEHSNKSVLDGITSALVSAWNTASTWITTNGANVLSHIADTVIHITAAERTAWTAKYDKPSGGIPASDLAETYLTAHQSLSAYRTSAAQDVIDATKQDTALTATVTISVADWNSGTTCTKNVTGVTASNIVICDSSDTSVQCTAQGAGTLTFTADATPTAAVTVKVVILP